VASRPLPGPRPPPAAGRPPAGPPPQPRPARTRTAVQDEAPDGRPRAWARALGILLGTVALGTVLALGADVLVGPVDGEPPLHLLVALALPFWDGLPARLGPRLLVLVAVVGAVAGGWLALAVLRPEPWWRAEVSFGLACAVVGTLQVALSARGRAGRTVER
jgi:hypothetical protein